MHPIRRAATPPILALLAAVLAPSAVLAQTPTPSSAPSPMPQHGASAAGPTYGVELENRQGKSVGSITLSQYPRGVFIHAEFQNLPTGWHGFHIHQTGVCTPDFEAAGGHFAPNGTGHGLDDRTGHAGDLPNVYVGADGTARYEAWTDAVSLTGGETSLFDSDGSAFVVHERPDDYVTDPSGNSGSRIACGVLEKRS